MIRNLLRPLLLLVTALAAAGCSDNIGSIWDREKGGGGAAGAGIEVVPAQGRIVDGRPRVEDAFPKGSGWPVTVPVVVVFSESIARSSIEPASQGGGGFPGTQPDALVYLRVEGTEQSLPAQIDWLLGDRVLLLSPLTALTRDTAFEVVVDTEVKDVDGVRKGGSGPDVVATFRTDQSDTFDDGQIVTTLPLDNERSVVRESDVFVIFDKPADPSTVTETSFRVEVGGVAVDGEREFPNEIANTPDPRVLRFRPAAALASEAQHEIVVDDTITFGQGKLEFEGRTPFSVFTTVRGAAPTSVAIGNPTAGFPNKVNAANLANVLVDVGVDASVPAGSRVLVRIYGLDAETSADEDLGYLEEIADVPQDGPTTVTVPFGASLGTPARLRFEEGPLSIVARVDVSRQASGFGETASGEDPALDVTPPVVEEFLPALAGASTDVVTDQESVAVLGRASEPIGSAELTVEGSSYQLFGSSADGTFVFRPVALGRRNAPVPFTMNATDAAGNMAPTAISGRILQRGLVTGTVAGSLTVEVYDEATFEPVDGALVVVEPDLPQKPAVGQMVATTDAAGRATVQGLSAGRHTITCVAAGYHLTTVFDTPAAFASLPVRPMDPAVATAQLAATLGFLPTSGQTGLLGCNAIDDAVALEVPTQGTPSVGVPEFDVRAGRPLVVNAFTGVFPPTGLPAFSGYACRMCGADGSTASAPEAPLLGDASAQLTIPILPGVGAAIGLAAPYEVDFAAAGGLGALDSEPVVRVHGTLAGFGGSALFGTGFSTVVAGARYSMNASYALPIHLALLPFQPTLWVSSTARDADGNLSRHRQLITEPNLGLTFSTGGPLGVPTVQSPAGPSTGSPAVTFEDRLDPAVIPGGVGFFTLRVTDPAGRRWTLLRFDSDAASGPDTLQLPDLSGIGAPPLAAGAWDVAVDAELMFSNAVDGDFVLEERRRQQVKFARAVAVSFDVQ